jgi:ubiquinone/menaquinone biosynthesis C-methylase UbiE
MKALDQGEIEEIMWNISKGVKFLSDLEARFIVSLLEYLEEEQKEVFKRVLDVACGWGRHHKILRRKGFEVYGLDLNKRFVEKARKLYPEFSYQVGDMRKLPYRGESFDAILDIFTSFGYFSEEENKKCLEEFYRVLRRGGIFTIETTNADWAKCNFQHVYTEEVGDDLLVISKGGWEGKFWVWNRSLYHQRGENLRKIGERKARLRLYSKDELDKLAEEIGYEPLIALSGLSAQPLKQDSPRMLLVYRKG